ncbi:MAG: recombinase family protein [Propionivibrio sp.]
MIGERIIRRCAIYTRKSNESGLEQDFNSLDAQREACEAFIKSQAHEGWQALPMLYDDGGYSGGSMLRPGLKLLLADIEAGKIDVVVVYKIDRLTRNLTDFARMVELFDKQETSFVSVTQAFNTTNSMGRLTLNVLLSFAQFEREVTGERIRDKIAASKAKGLWMGGNLPLGYDAPDEGIRLLKVNDTEAETVRRIFAKYLELDSVHELREWLIEQAIGPKQWVAASGRKIGSASFSRGALFHLLRNPVYRGMIRHKGLLHEGGHGAIIDAKTFERVQVRLDHKANRWKEARNPVVRAPLATRIFDAVGQPMSPSFCHGKRGQVYRYYVSSTLQQGGKPSPSSDLVQRIPGPALEQQLTDALERLLPEQADNPLTLPRRIEIHRRAVHVLLDANLATGIAGRLDSGEKAVSDPANPKLVRLELPVRIRHRRGRTSILLSKGRTTRCDEVMIDALRRAHAMVKLDRQRLPTCDVAPPTQYERRLIRLAFLAPDLQVAILEGRQPAHLNVEQLIELPLPIAWIEQRALFNPQHSDRINSDLL